MKKPTAKIRAVRPQWKEICSRLVLAMRDVRGHRQMNAAESPETQDAWDRLKVVMIEVERLLEKPRRKKENRK
jgi:hypothetical protein